jgi:hypothetical protein
MRITTIKAMDRGHEVWFAFLDDEARYIDRPITAEEAAWLNEVDDGLIDDADAWTEGEPARRFMTEELARQAAEAWEGP